MYQYVAALLLAFGMGVAGLGHAAFGERDCSFGSNGIHTFQYSSSTNNQPVWFFSEEASGSILARVGFASALSSIFRMDADGTASTQIAGTIIQGVVDAGDTILPDGKVLYPNGVGLGPTLPPGVGRLLSTGARDTTFGTDGFATLSGFTNASTRPLVQSDGRIVVGGTRDNKAVLVRFNADGTVDTTFGASGVATTPSSVGPFTFSIALQPDGRILLLGPYTLVRYMPDGTLDASFGTGGSINLSAIFFQGWRVRLQPSGKILVLGTHSGSGFYFRLARFDATGNLDPTAAGGVGYRDVTFPPETNVGPDTTLTPLDVMPDGRPIVVGAQSFSPTSIPGAMIRYGVDLGDDAAIPLDFKPGGVKVLANGKLLVGRTGFNMPPEARRFLGDLDASTCVTTTTSVTSSPNPSNFGQSVTLTATVTPASSPPAPGSVQFRRNGVDLGSPVALVNGVASLPSSTLPEGVSSLTAVYLGAGVYLASTSPAHSHTVTPRPPSTTTLSSAPNPSDSGQAVTLTATVAPQSGPGTPAGTVQFKDGLNNLGSAVALTSGTATLIISTLGDGNHNLTAVYSGDADFAPSTSNTVAHFVRGRLTINDPSANAASGPATMSFVVTLTAPPQATVTVSYATSDRTAIAGTHYTATSGTLTFDPGQTLKTVDVPITQGPVGPNKDFFLTLSNPVNASLAKGAGVGTITYIDTSTLAVYVADTAVIEGPSGVTLMGFNVSLSRPNTAAVGVDFATADGTAVFGADYTPRSGRLSFPSNVTQLWVMVPIHGNVVVDGNRALFLNLSNASAGVIGRGQATGTIVDDDPTPAATSVPMLRLYSDVTKEHLYTTDGNEYAILGTRGWVQEGTAYTMFANPGTFGSQVAIPFYRMYRPGILQHHWTTDANEVMVLVSEGSWQYEGISGYLLPAADTGTTPLYRLMLAAPPLHLWTTDANEKDVLTTPQYGWVYEGITGEVLP